MIKKISELIKELEDTKKRLGDLEIVAEVDDYGEANIRHVYEMGDPIKLYIYID